MILVTGASRGIGRSILEALAGQGALVIGTYLDSQTAAVNISADHRCEMHRLDLSGQSKIHEFFLMLSNRHERLDGVVNNAGILLRSKLSTLKKKEIASTFAVNLFGPMWVTRYAERMMTRGGSIVNVSSNGALRGGTAAPHYAASKAALISWTKSTARLLGPRIRVNAVAPGMISTDMHTDTELPEGIVLDRWGKTDDVAQAVVFLLDERSSGYITGQTLVIDGGQCI